MDEATWLGVKEIHRTITLRADVTSFFSERRGRVYDAFIEVELEGAGPSARAAVDMAIEGLRTASTAPIRVVLREIVEESGMEYEQYGEEFEYPGTPQAPTIVCLVGSTRFKRQYEEETRRLTLEGKIVLTCGVWVHHEAENAKAPEVKARLDRLHEAKIDMADEVRVINVGKYVGDSTRREIEYAKGQGKRLTYLEAPDA